VAADVPSGVNAATGEVEGPAIHASVTTTNHAPKIGLYAAPGARHAGEVRVVDIGIPRGAPEAGLVGLISRRVLRLLVPARPRYAAPSDTVLVVGGGRASTGAPAMAAEAAMSAGTCYVRAAVPASVAPFMDLRLPGALIRGLAEKDGRHVEAGARTIAGLAPEAGAVVLGPGLDGTEGAFSRAVGSSTEVPMVIEAGGLSAFLSAEAFSERSGFTVLILDEAGLGRLLGLPPEEVEARRLASARALADRAGAVAVLEGNGCVVATPGGPVALGPAASGALAANGTGSALAGVVGTFLARGMGPLTAAAAAVLARAEAGNVAAARVGASHTVAGDVIQALPEALAPSRD
ncbi:MAG TPA: NAD(P)H-hydrate dehydratase, partial [Isosphaeraceae bacterium]